MINGYVKLFLSRCFGFLGYRYCSFVSVIMVTNNVIFKLHAIVNFVSINFSFFIYK